MVSHDHSRKICFVSYSWLLLNVGKTLLLIARVNVIKVLDTAVVFPILNQCLLLFIDRCLYLRQSYTRRYISSFEASNTPFPSLFLHLEGFAFTRIDSLDDYYSSY